MTHSLVSNNICSKVLTIYWLRNGRICYRYFTSEETGRSWCKQRQKWKKED